VIFRKKNEELILKLRKEVMEEIDSLPPEEKAWVHLAQDLYQREVEKMFLIMR